jgi:hypothetical protein
LAEFLDKVVIVVDEEGLCQHGELVPRNVVDRIDLTVVGHLASRLVECLDRSEATCADKGRNRWGLEVKSGVQQSLVYRRQLARQLSP